jgi:rhodanese-related sulfurtransferase
MFGWFRNKNIKKFLERDAIIVDVRTPAEFKQAHAKGAVNMPMNIIEARTKLLKKKGRPVILCCRSGMRAGKALKILENAGIEAVNGGGWKRVGSFTGRIVD